jgi:hypothetical protein
MGRPMKALVLTTDEQAKLQLMGPCTDCTAVQEACPPLDFLARRLSNPPSALRELVATLQGTLQAAQVENNLLRQRLELFLKRYFGGPKNESLDPKQLELLLAGLTALCAPTPVAEKKTSARTTTARPVRQPLPAHLETERVVLEPAEVQQQPAGWRTLGEEVTEELDWKPAEFLC